MCSIDGRLHAENCAGGHAARGTGHVMEIQRAGAHLDNIRRQDREFVGLIATRLSRGKRSLASVEGPTIRTSNNGRHYSCAEL